MFTVRNRVLKKSLISALIFVLVLSWLFSYTQTVYADKVVLSEQAYYHLDMGVQIAYNSGCDWGSDNIYGNSTPLSVNTTITFNSDVEVLDTYPLNSSKGGSFDFSGETSSHNIPRGLGAGDSAYDIYYANYVSTLMTEGSCNSSGRKVSFGYTARLSTPVPLEVVELGEDDRGSEIYRLFGGKSALEADQPEIAEAIDTALTAGRNGTAGTNKLYLVFCPNVIKYRKYITVGDLEAKLALPSSAKQGESYTASDASIVDGGLTVDSAVLEKHYGDGIWETADEWDGTGSPGTHTGGSVNEVCDEICTITYRLTVTATNGQTDTDTKTINITDGREIDGQAVLMLPEFTFEGHPALAEDWSEFVVDGVSYSARRAYEENVASNRFRPLPSGSGSASKLSLTTANVTFPVRGNYSVRLEVSTADGKELTDTKPIEVRKTPSIIDNLGGFQKQNRKQILNISVATYPGKPIVDYYVKLRDLKTGEEITLTPEQPQENSAAIKTRAITNGGDQYWAEFNLEFLTKTPAYDPDHPDASQDFRYTIYMKDSKGDTDTVQKTFTVKPDRPPNAQITIKDSFIRNKGANIAEIKAEDSSITDGDQLQRTWTVKGINVISLPGFKDNSFGSRQKVQYNKTGVGKESITLSVKDVWTEPTLEEYITESDYLSASTSATTEVVNIAPAVRLEPIETETADVIIMTEKSSESGIKAGINSIKAALIEAGIDANVQVIPTAKPNSDGYNFVGGYEWRAAINDPVQNSAGLVFDSEYAYAIEASGFRPIYYYEECIPPYTVRALKQSDAGTGLETAWSYTVTESTNFRLYIDSSENYVCLSCLDTGKTILLNRKNGAYLTTLTAAIPSRPYITGNNNNLYFLSGSNIQKYDPDTGALKTVINKGGSCGRVQNGKITFINQISAYEFCLAQFDMNTETISYQSYPKLSEYDWSYSAGKAGVSVTDLDSNGNAVFLQTYWDNQSDRERFNIWVVDKESQTVRTHQIVGSDMRSCYVGFVKDETGKGVYLYRLYVRPGSSSMYHYFDLYDLSKEGFHNVYSTSYKRTNGANLYGINYAKLHTQEDYIYILQGSDFGLEGSQWAIRMRIKLPSFTAEDGSSYYNWKWDVADETAGYHDGMMLTYYKWDRWLGTENRVKMFTTSITKEQAEESALTRLVDLAQNTTRVIEKNFISVQTLVEKVKAAVKETTSLKLKTTGGVINLSKSFILKPGKTYYYEYEVKKPSDGEDSDPAVHVTAPQPAFDTKNVYEGAGNLESYYVTDIIEEDFNGPLNPFFTLTSGMINDGLQTQTSPKYSSTRDIGLASTVSFTIPEGKTAVAMMDITGACYSLSGTGYRSGVYINGQRYDRPLASDLNVLGYVHPYPLKEGVNTIQAYICDRTNQITSEYVKIDNLKILFLDKVPDTAAGNTFSSAKTADGWTKVTGSFQAPEKILKFKSQEMEYYPDWPPGYVYSEGGGIAYKYYDFTIPSGKTAKIFGTFQGWAQRDDTTAATFSFPTGWQLVHRGTRYASKGILAYVDNGETFYINNHQGATRFSTIYNNNSRTASYSKLAAYVYPENLKDKYSFFFQDGKVYSISDTFDGKMDFKISLNTGGNDTEVLLQNLKIYSLNNGSKVYLHNKPLRDTSELSGWTVTENALIEMATETKPEREEDAPLVYKKGQLVSYNIFYDDYENDPSKKQYWRYTHTPYNDGPHPDAAVILDEDGNVVSDAGIILSQSIPRFYIDGKYTVEHWQEDNTNRTDDASGETDYDLYDKLSNTESITFYVEGGATAPWITSIRTIPGTVKEGDQYRLQIGVDDLEKDELRLTTELYLDRKLIYTHKESGITADASGNYPYVITGTAPPAAPGNYEAVCTVRDETGAGIGTYKFTVVSEGKITGFVNHTDQWDENRKKYNLKRFGEEGNRPMQLNDYRTMPAPRLRGTNVFWSGEKFMLRSETEGKPIGVDVRILSVNGQGIRNDTGYSTELSNTGRKTAAGAELWEGSLWDNGMINQWGRKSPEQLVFLFTAYYAGGSVRTSEAEIIVDSLQDYWQLHRLW